MRFVNIHRAIALSHIVWNILCVTGIVKGGTKFGRHNRGSEIRDMFTQTRNATGVDGTVRVDKDLLKTSEYACSSCGTPESRLPPTQRMLRCSGCNVIGRTMVYCSRKCQREDWSEGRPTPHKQICGRASEKRNIPV
ncbi:hypothetical protein PHLGIDRAFT_19938 [Phlebiopsis gigantea 11061_1 CR5-6]|uniref:MYND-type domain-containing protein n=1 Tax=Phlebiopsis gigantea (strain 11061_1 CR5-6) TaxID=745531 RepID=A0A0C3RUD4_PHLG1|nr:hypothetical protein PHLGIDRAFT_19938 [Phlebiopsis gigantea 11061_1 CR5-6]